MKRIFPIIMILLAASIPALYVEASQNKSVSGMDGGSDVSNTQILETLRQALINASFKDVVIVPQIFVAIAKTPDGKRSTLLVDATTMQAMELDGTDNFVAKASQRDPASQDP
jgi:hypothetical protein